MNEHLHKLSIPTILRSIEINPNFKKKLTQTFLSLHYLGYPMVNKLVLIFLIKLECSHSF